MRVTVTLPQTEEPEKGGKFTSYLVSFHSSTGSGGEGCVRRRYSDFQWLTKRLQTECPGAIIPVIPHARVMMGSGKKFDDDFIEERRKNLQLFLEGVVDHPELSRARSMTPFMTLTMGEDFENGKKKAEHVQPTSDVDLDKAGDELYLGNGDVESSPVASRAGAAKRGLGQLFAKIRVSVGNKELQSTDNEGQVVALQEYIAQATKATKKLVKASDALTKSTLETANLYGEMVAPLDEWKTAYQTTLETKEPKGGMVDAISSLSEFATDFSTLLRRKHIDEETAFCSTMHSLQNVLLAYRRALGQRKNWQVTYTATTKQIADKEVALAKAEKNYKPPEVTDKIANEITQLENRRELEKSTFEDCTDRVLRDAETYKPQVQTLLKKAFSQYAQIQLSYTDRVQEAFGELLPYLDDSDNNSNANSSSLPPPPPPTAYATLVSNGTNINGLPSPPNATSPPPPITDDDIESELEIDGGGGGGKAVFKNV
jgi:PX domain/Vps5 C terminal like